MLPVQVSGREVFEFRPELVNDDDEEADDTKYTNVDDEFTEQVTSCVHLHMTTQLSITAHCVQCALINTYYTLCNTLINTLCNLMTCV